VHPGDTTRFELHINEMTHKVIKFSGKAFVGDTEVCESDYVVYYRIKKTSQQ
jgi:3-hydroxymyristoyl/3-hydroxydecanoyl-(acyl carrier protein) dehydratase